MDYSLEFLLYVELLDLGKFLESLLAFILLLLLPQTWKYPAFKKYVNYTLSEKKIL